MVRKITLNDPFPKVFHGCELPFVFNDPDGLYIEVPLVLDTDEKKLALVINNYWTSFVATGAPQNLPNSTFPAWPQFKASSEIAMSLEMSPFPVPRLKERLCDMWDKLDLNPKP